MISEVHGGTRGTSYVYIADEKSRKLIHIAHLTAELGVKSLEFESHRGRKRGYKHELPLSELCRKFGSPLVLFVFNYSNRGYGPYIRKYVINCKTGTISEWEPSKEELARYRVEILGPESEWVSLYERYVPAMVAEIRKVAERLGFELWFMGRAVRLQDIYEEPIAGRLNALILPYWQSRQKALETYVRMIHELYVAVLVADALDAKTTYHDYEGKPYWWIEQASDIPTAVLKTPYGTFTLWYQFSLLRQVDVVRIGMLRLFAPNVTRLGGRLYVRPDLVLFRGEYHSRHDLMRNLPERSILIDAKIELTDADVTQLKAYVDAFSERFRRSVKYIVACMHEVPPNYGRVLKKLGYHVVEWVVPQGTGVSRFKSLTRSLAALSTDTESLML